ncbi:ubiquitin-conjugating enzyme E2S [Aspergillus terreus NIH2624]|uniref:Ubiquitin-conjugating enzyme E2S n=1 Tax=Aspergillus terreus (strain NIH 2624 / FGSC A1156) TaxID=341663 RepID=Q0D160_ASPTN|nr:ubiquitin-conjugating enzyme E2S [Aspergillus terreus NIH2624]EAU38970.1 ubiquitin-conjugating enzyme E2S [Aspergillus terreus NIH2624]
MPDDYPKSPPKATFKTRIWHPNVEESTGAVCVDTLKRDWKATLTLKDVLITISCLLIYPNPDSALNSTAGALLQENYEAFARQAKLMTSIHAPVPTELKDTVVEAKSRGEDAGAMPIPEETSTTTTTTTTRSLRSRKGAPVQSVTMKKNTRRTRAPSPPPQAPAADHADLAEAEPSDTDSDAETVSNASKENDPSLSPSPVKFAPPSPRKNALGKRPLSVLTMPLECDPDDDLDEDSDADGPPMTASEKNIAANARHAESDRSPQRKSPKLSVLHQGVNASGRIRDDMKIFEDAVDMVPADEFDRRRSGDGKENHASSFGGAKTGSAARRPGHGQGAAALVPSAGTVGSGSKTARPMPGTRKVSGSQGKKPKPRIGIRRL